MSWHDREWESGPSPGRQDGRACLQVLASAPPWHPHAGEPRQGLLRGRQAPGDVLARLGFEGLPERLSVGRSMCASIGASAGVPGSARLCREIMLGVFISFSHEDDATNAGELGAYLRSSYGGSLEPVLAPRTRSELEENAAKVGRLIRSCPWFVVFYTSRGRLNQWVNQELGYAISLAGSHGGLSA